MDMAIECALSLLKSFIALTGIVKWIQKPASPHLDIASSWEHNTSFFLIVASAVGIFSVISAVYLNHRYRGAELRRYISACIFSGMSVLLMAGAIVMIAHGKSVTEHNRQLTAAGECRALEDAREINLKEYVRENYQ